MTDGITAEQREALRFLAPIVGPEAYLAGGVAVALRVGHRLSRDVDLFVSSGAPEDLVDRLSETAQPVHVVSRAPGTLYLEVGGVPTSIIRYPYHFLRPTVHLPGIAVPVAAPEDLVCMKLSAIAGRGARRDFWDLHALLEAIPISLDKALQLFREKYPIEDVGHVIRSLVYFADADAEPALGELSPESWSRIKIDLTREVRAL